MRLGKPPPALPDWLARCLNRLLMFLVAGCCLPTVSSAHENAAAGHADTPPPVKAEVGETPALDLSAFTTVERIIPALAGKRVVFVGEQHTRYDHHLTQLEIIRRLHAMHPQLAIGIEAFQQPFQQHLDEYIAGTISEQEMLEATEYYRRWRMDYRLYAPILRYAREQQLPVVALNLPVELTRKVGQVGLEGLEQEDRDRLPALIDRSDAAYEQRIRAVFRRHPNDSGQEFAHFLEVQLLWDEGMAERAAGFLEANPEHHMVILAGIGHLANGSGIPRRLTRRLAVDTAIVLNGWDGPVEPGLADFLLLPAAQKLPPRGKMGAILEEKNAAIRIATCTTDSACANVGIKAGDRIMSIDDRAIDDMVDVPLALWDKQPGDTVFVDIVRKRWLFPAKNLTFAVILK